LARACSKSALRTCGCALAGGASIKKIAIPIALPSRTVVLEFRLSKIIQPMMGSRPDKTGVVKYNPAK
jgi:hypothetical protein